MNMHRNPLVTPQLGQLPPTPVETSGWTPAASQLRIRLLLNREPREDVELALAYEARRLAALQGIDALSM